MKLSSIQYSLYTWRDHEKICKHLREVVEDHYPNAKAIFYSQNHKSIIISSDYWLIMDRNSIFLPWDQMKISPLELDTLLGMEKL